MPSGLVGTIYTQSNSDFTLDLENSLIFSCIMWIFGGFARCGPSVLLATKKASFEIKTCHLAFPLIKGQKIVDFQKKIVYLFILPFIDQKVVFWVNKTVF